MTVRDMTEAHWRDLFDLTRRAAHVVADPLVLETRRNAAKRIARMVGSQTAAPGVVQEAIRRPDRTDGEAVRSWTASAGPSGVAIGAEKPPGLEDPESLEVMDDRFDLPLTEPAE